MCIYTCIYIYTYIYIVFFCPPGPTAGLGSPGNGPGAKHSAGRAANQPQ